MDERFQASARKVVYEGAVKQWWRRWVLTSASPGAAVALRRMNAEIDARHTLSAIRVPTLVVHRVGDETTEIDEGRYMAERIPGAEMVELPGVDHGYWVEPEQIAQEVERFLRGIWDRGEWDAVETDRVLATVLFTDIVDSTAKLAELGDRGWRELLQQHHALVRRQLVRYSGREIDTAGDGFFASFDGPARGSGAHAPSAMSFRTRASRFVPAFTPVSARSWTARSEVSRFTSGLGWRPRRHREKSSSRAR